MLSTLRTRLKSQPLSLGVPRDTNDDVGRFVASSKCYMMFDNHRAMTLGVHPRLSCLNHRHKHEQFSQPYAAAMLAVLSTTESRTQTSRVRAKTFVKKQTIYKQIGKQSLVRAHFLPIHICLGFKYGIFTFVVASVPLLLLSFMLHSSTASSIVASLGSATAGTNQPGEATDIDGNPTVAEPLVLSSSLPHM
jgi:hypothetical protein